MYSHVVIHYGEIGIKKGNRPFFERALARNIKKNLADERLKRGYGRFVIELSQNSNIEMLRNSLSKVFGIANYSFAVYAELNLDEIISKSLEFARQSDAQTFRITTMRSNKNFPLSSIKVNEIVGSAVSDLGKRVSLKSPELEIFIELAGKKAYIYDSQIKGLGGLPVGTSGKVMCLLSGGIDSPVASFLAMKRGCKCILIHFHNYTLYQESVKKKIIEIAKKLSQYNGKTRLIIVPFADMQKNIISSIPPEYRMLSYRRFMLRIADVFREQLSAKAFITGDNLAQVASQTLENLDTIYSVAKKPILAPLLGFDKKDIIKMAESIGTYEISIQPYNDCCSSFIAEHPATRSKKEELDEMEKNIDCQKLIEGAVSKSETIFI